MKTCLYVIVAGAFFVISGESRVTAGFVPGEQLPLYYDVSTGNVTINTTDISGGEFVGYSLVQPVVVGEIHFLYEHHTPFMPNLFSAISTARAIQETSWPNEPLTPGVYSLGNILPAGLTGEELSLDYFGETGFLSTPFNRSRFTYGAYGSFDVEPAQFHVFEINYSPSPFPPLNDPNPQPLEEVDWATEAALSYDPGDGTVYLQTTGPNGGRSFGYQNPAAGGHVSRRCVQCRNR